MKHFESPNEIKELREKNVDLLEKSDYLETISGNNKTGWIIRKSSPKDDYWIMSLIEAAKCKVLIIDERIWEQISNVNINSKDLNIRNEREKLVFEKKNIELWDLFLDKNNENKISFKNLVGKEITMEDLKKNRKVKYDIVAVHQGIIDKIIDNSKYKLYELECLFSNLGDKIVTHSGRSKPDLDTMLFGNEGNFISFTSLCSALADSKYHLVNLLYSVRVAQNE